MQITRRMKAAADASLIEVPGRGEMAVASAIMFLMGGLLVSVSVVLAPWPLPTIQLLLIGAPGFVAAPLIFRYGRFIPLWGHQVLAFCGNALVTLAVLVCSGTPMALLMCMLYPWVALFVFTFFSPIAAIVHTLIALAACATVFALREGATSVTVMLFIVSSAVLTGGICGWLVHKLRVLAATDELTGLPNRRVLRKCLEAEQSRAKREHTPLAVAAVDLDAFKGYNDRHGHAAGDGLLQEVAREWRQQIRPVDLLARTGGDEFMLVLPGADQAVAESVVERLRRATPKPLFCSAGLVISFGDENPDQLLIAADRALYRAKASGGDQTSCEPTADEAATPCDSEVATS